MSTVALPLPNFMVFVPTGMIRETNFEPLGADPSLFRPMLDRKASWA